VGVEKMRTKIEWNEKIGKSGLEIDGENCQIFIGGRSYMPSETVPTTRDEETALAIEFIPAPWRLTDTEMDAVANILASATKAREWYLAAYPIGNRGESMESMVRKIHTAVARKMEAGK
jgi:hypothetical protein